MKKQDGRPCNSTKCRVLLVAAITAAVNDAISAAAAMLLLLLLMVIMLQRLLLLIILLMLLLMLRLLLLICYAFNNPRSRLFTGRHGLWLAVWRKASSVFNSASRQARPHLQSISDNRKPLFLLRILPVLWNFSFLPSLVSNTVTSVRILAYISYNIHWSVWIPTALRWIYGVNLVYVVLSAKSLKSRGPCRYDLFEVYSRGPIFDIQV